MATIYKDPRPDGRRDHFYLCAGAYHLGGEQCGRIAGQRLDEAVVEAVRKRLGRPALEAIRLAWEEAKAGESAERHRVEVEVHRARQAEVEAAYRYQCVDPGNRLVAADLERKLEEAKREVRRVERLVAAQKEEPPTLDDDAFRELCELCGDFMALWNAKTTTNHDRKEIIRTIVKEVGVEEKGPAVVKLCVVWQDGEADTLIEARQARYGQKVIAELAAEGLASKEIAARLNAIGILTMRNRPWREQTVEKAIERMGRRGEERRHHAS